jgi:hypothetical protein
MFSGCLTQPKSAKNIDGVRSAAIKTHMVVGISCISFSHDNFIEIFINKTSKFKPYQKCCQTYLWVSSTIQLCFSPTTFNGKEKKLCCHLKVIS